MRLTAIFLFFLLPEIASSEIPSTFVDSGACPGEGCGYGAPYEANAAVPIFERPSTSSKRIGEVASGDTFLSKTGEVHTVPTRFEVLSESGPFRPGDDVYALTYLGEGYFRIFHNGKLTQADLGFSPWGGSAGKTCDKPEHCFGILSEELEFTWWLFVLSETGMEGWVVADESIRGIDSNR